MQLILYIDLVSRSLAKLTVVTVDLFVHLFFVDNHVFRK